MTSIPAIINKLIANLGIEVIRRRDRNFDAILSEIFGTLSPRVIFDIGAHNGSSILRFRKLFGQSNVIHSFEVNPNLVKNLLADFGHDQNVRVCDKAVSDIDRELVSFNVHDTSTGSSSLLEVNQDRKFAKRRNISSSTISRITVETTTLDCYALTNNVQSINLLKIDTQGTELRVLRGAKSLLSKSAIDVIEFELIVMDAYETSIGTFEILTYLDSYGYKLVALSNDSRSNNKGFSDILGNPELQFDLIFVSKVIYKNLIK